MANPGSTPLTKMETPPSLAASTVGVIIPSSTTPKGYCRKTGPDETTLMPALSMPLHVAERLEQPVVGHGTCGRSTSGFRAKMASTSLVAATPSVRSRPASSPASLPTLSGFDTHTPTSSRSGRASIPAMTWRPTLPVLQATTR